MVKLTEAETKSLDGVKVRFVVNNIDENGKIKNGVATTTKSRKSTVPFTELPLVK
jgi:hypothetical protein